MLYEVVGWSLLKQSIIHFIAMMVIVFPILLLSGWYPLNNAADYLKLIGIFLLFGLVFWSVGYLVFGKLLKK